jgi:phage baseplate assembly protein V
MVARAVVRVVDDTPSRQRLQVRALEDEDIDDGERWQQYGFSSVPLTGADAVVLFPGGDRGHPLVIAVDDRRHRPSGGDPGDVVVYHHDGARIHLQANGDVVISAKPGAKVFIDDGSGGAEPLVTKSQFDAHVHPTGTGPSGVPNNVATSGTTVLRGK